MKDFTMIVNEVVSDGGYCLLTGKGKGEELAVSDEIFVCTTNGNYFKTTAEDISKSEADKESITIKCQKPAQADVTRYAVASTIEPKGAPDSKSGVENPFLLGLSREMKDRGSVPEYNSAIIYASVHSIFLAPAKIENSQKDENDKVVFTGETKVAYPLLPAQHAPGKKVLAVYTDNRAYALWKDKIGGNEPGSCMVLPFPGIYQLVLDMDLAGVVVNPFSLDASVILKRELLDTLVNSEVYKRDISSSRAGNVRVGTPADSAEVRKIREILMDYGVEHNEIVEIYLLVRFDGKSSSYMIPFSCEGEPKEIAMNMGEILKPHLKDITNVAFGPIDIINSLDKETALEALIHRRV